MRGPQTLYHFQYQDLRGRFWPATMKFDFDLGVAKVIIGKPTFPYGYLGDFERFVVQAMANGTPEHVSENVDADGEITSYTVASQWHDPNTFAPLGTAYNVQVLPETVDCECPWGSEPKNLGEPCSHIAALYVYTKADAVGRREVARAVLGAIKASRQRADEIRSELAAYATQEE